MAHGACPPPGIQSAIHPPPAAGSVALDRDNRDRFRPRIVGALLHAALLQALPGVHLTKSPRMADFAPRLAEQPLARGSGSAFTTERNLDTERPKKRLYATQVAGEGAGIFRPTGAVLGIRSLLRSTLARRRSAALPVQEGRSLMNSRRDRGHHRPPIRSPLARGMRLMR